MKGKKQYRYYISQNLILMRGQAADIPGRFPAHEIENTVEKVLRTNLSDTQKLERVLRLPDDNDPAILLMITENQSSIPFDCFLNGAIKRITVRSGLLEIALNVPKLIEVLSDKIRRQILFTNETAILPSEYKTSRTKKGAVVIEPPKSGQDIFDLPPDRLKKLIQGFVWRDEHFSGMALKDIAIREQCSQSYIGTAIFSTFNILQ